MYGTLLKWPNENIVLGAPKVNEYTTVSMLGYNKPIKWSKLSGKLILNFYNVEKF